MRSGRNNYTSYLTAPYPVQPANTVDFREIGGGKIGTDQILGQAITEAQLADGSISSAKIGAISADDISTGTLDASSVTITNLNATNITTGTLSVNRIGNASITGAKIASSTITGGNIAGTTITASNIANSTITGAKIASGTITGSNIDSSTITGSNIVNSTITGGKIATGTITGTQLSTSRIDTTYQYIQGGLKVGGAAATTDYFVAGDYAYFLSVPSAASAASIALDSGGRLIVPTSDGRLKKDITDYKGGLDGIMSLRPVSFTWKESGQKDTGLIAQEVEGAFPMVAYKREGHKYYTMDYAKLITPLIGAVQQQQKQIEELRAEIKELKKMI